MLSNQIGLWLNRVRYTIYTPIYNLVIQALQKSRAEAISRLEIPPKAKILIVGAGTGKDLAFLPKDAEISAIDITPSMLSLLKAEALRTEHNVQTAVMDAAQLDYGDESFDLVLLHLILAVVPNPTGCITEASRVLKTTGQISLFDKFVPEGQKASPLRKLANLITRVLFSDISRSAEPYLQQGQLTKVSDQPAFLGGQFRHIVAKKA
ncbi:Methyltransferase domain-containing protein [Oceanospirillum multiglobuliferum]|uniref:Methyltransferase type 11 domain-containing protein n=1 Tax=Oceanospirillum multiglobuliferum TaxID=64969 RepID=A0A1T4L7D1_9GAMM|nr:class I SAM-dependent methyltransferase [Oceanospirillum multiglobuliferum]OPX56769.1 hypothetical protein BTE48_02505 [Oceanospirillum multiglobuliferum]SJZ50574.1 Methyltransferase domain-containing protein [Oceanospirillum multiglobuliferum]